MKYNLGDSIPPRPLQMVNLTEQDRQDWIEYLKRLCLSLPKERNNCDKCKTGSEPDAKPRKEKNIDLCLCGHARMDHIYLTGACRPGFLCLSECKSFHIAEPVEK